MNLKNPQHAYIFGFLQTDGHIGESTQNRSRVTIEISDIDATIIEKIHNILSVKSTIFRRQRVTNFGPCSLIGLRVCNREFTDELKKLGIPAGRKSLIIKSPTVPFSKRDYFRGLFDGDGSVGIDKNGFPFIGFVTQSKALAYEVSYYISEIIGSRFNPCKNKRDQIYTITVTRENAQILVKHLYYKRCLSLDRKQLLAERILEWKRPIGLKRIPRKQKWDEEQDRIIFNNPFEDAAKILKRSIQSVKCRKWRISSK